MKIFRFASMSRRLSFVIDALKHFGILGYMETTFGEWGFPPFNFIGL